MHSTRLVLPEKDDNEEMALVLNGKKRKFILQDFISFGQNLKLINRSPLKLHSGSLQTSNDVSGVNKLVFAKS